MESFPENTDIEVSMTFKITDSETKIDPDSNQAYITIKDVEGDDVLASTLMTRDSQGEYSYWWETSAVGTGVFTVIITGEFTGRTYVGRDKVELE